MGESLSGDLDGIDGKSGRVQDLAVLIGVGLQDTAKSGDLRGQVIGNSGSDSGDDIVRKAEYVADQTGSRSSNDCRARGSNKESRKSHYIDVPGRKEPREDEMLSVNLDEAGTMYIYLTIEIPDQLTAGW